MQNRYEPIASYSPLTAAARSCFQALDRISLRRWLAFRIRVLKPRWQISATELESVEFTKCRSRAIEWYVIFWLAVEICLVLLSLVVGMSGCLPSIISLIASCRIIEVLQVTINAAVFDSLSGRSDASVALVERMVVLAGVNFIELGLCFGVIYAAHLRGLRGAANSIDAYYFSFITQLTIGYGDICPTGALRIVAVLQGLMGVAFVVLVFARFLAGMKQISSVLDGTTGRRREE